MPTTTEQRILTEAAEALYDGGAFSLMTANRWNGTDLHVSTGRTLRITREDPGGDYWIGVLSPNRILERHAEVSGNVQAETLVAIARAVWLA